MLIPRELGQRAVAALAARAIANARVVLMATTVLAALLLGYTLTHLSLNTSIEHMLDDNLHFRQLEQQFDHAFPRFLKPLVVVIDAATPERAAAAAEELAAQLKAEPSFFASVYLPAQPEFFASHGLLYLETAELWKLSDRLSEAAPFLGALAQDRSLAGLFSTLSRALDERLSADYQARIKAMLDTVREAIEAQLQGRAYSRSWQDLLSGDAEQKQSQRSFVLAQPVLNKASSRPAGPPLDRAHSLAQAMEAADEQLHIRFTGPVALDDEEFESVHQGAGIATLASFVMVCVILFLGLRSRRLMAAILLTLCFGLICTAAFAAFVFGALNLLSVTFAVLFIGLGVDFGIQFGMRYREEANARPDKNEALNYTARGVAGALTLAAVAAAVSFFSFVPTSYRGLAELGVISAAGMFIALAANLIVLPALLAVMRVPIEFSRTTIARASHLQFTVGRHRKQILWSAVLLAVVSALLAPFARFDFNPINLKDDRTESVATVRDLLRDPDSTPYTIDVVAANLAQAEELAGRLQKLPEVDKVITLASFVPDHQEEKLGIVADLALVLQPLITSREPAKPPAPETERAALERFRTKLQETAGKKEAGNYADSARALAQAIMRFQEQATAPAAIADLRQHVLGDLSPTLKRLGQLLTPRKVTLANLPRDLKENYQNAAGLARIEVFPKENVGDNRALRRFVEAVQAVAPNAIGASVSLVEGGDAVVKASLQASIYALLGTLALLLLVMRRLTDTLCVLLPLALSALLTVACSVLFNIPFNFANLIALPLLLGIGIAFGIYLVMRRRDGMNIQALFESSTPRAVFFSAATTIASFGALAFSPHRGMSSMGVLLTLALSFALFSTLIVLPALMAKAEDLR